MNQESVFKNFRAPRANEVRSSACGGQLVIDPDGPVVRTDERRPDERKSTELKGDGSHDLDNPFNDIISGTPHSRPGSHHHHTRNPSDEMLAHRDREKAPASST